MATKWMKSLHCQSKAHHHVLSTNSASCKKSVQNLRDIVEITKMSRSKKRRPHSRINPEPGPQPPDRTRSRGTESAIFPSLTELPEGHASRNVVEIIFHTSWGEKHFTGRVEMVFKIHNLTRTMSRFEEYRKVVRRRAVGHARSVADGNEVMGFYCLGGSEIGAAVCTFPGSGVAHESVGGGRGRRAMLVCRVGSASSWIMSR